MSRPRLVFYSLLLIAAFWFGTQILGASGGPIEVHASKNYTSLQDFSLTVATTTDTPPVSTETASSTPTILLRRVAWVNAVNVTAKGNTIQKTGGAGSTWDADAVSTEAIQSGDGYVQVTVDALNTYRMFGLSNGDTNTLFGDIDFAAYMAGSTLKVYERGLFKGTFGSIAVGDQVRVAVENGAVRYYLNGNPVFISSMTPVYPLLLDTSINSSLGRIYNAFISGTDLGSNATFTPTGTRSVVPTQTATYTSTPTFAPTNTAVPTGTDTPMSTNTAVPTNTGTPIPTNTAVPTGTPTRTVTATLTHTAIPTSTPMPPTQTATPTKTSQPTFTNTLTPTMTTRPTDTATRTPSATATRTFTVVPSATPTPGHLYGVVGQANTWDPLDTSLLGQQYNAGVRTRLFEMDWKDFQPTGPNDWDLYTQTRTQARIDALVATGPDVQFVLDLGMQYPPDWAIQIDPLTDQYGNRWIASTGNGGGANVYWSPTLRANVRTYIQKIFTTLNFRGRLWSVRVGPYMGELMYPDVHNPGANESFWAFDAQAQAQCPVPGWRPGDPSPNGEAQRFYLWYVDNLTNYFNFVLGEVRHYYAGYVAPVTPGGGMYSGTVNLLISRNLYDPQQSGYATGNYWQRIFSMVGPGDPNILYWCSSVGDLFPEQDDNNPNWWYWSSAKQQAYLAHLNGRPIYGENPGGNAFDTSTGADWRTTMQWDMQTVRTSNYLGLMWVRQSDMTNPQFASLAQYASLIAQNP